jgi:gamma-glutamylaminecyclotransferase
MTIFIDATKKDPTLVFVYGSLKQGFGNHHLLKNAHYLGAFETVARHKMISLGAFPGVIWCGGDHTIKGEVYDVIDENDRIALDNLEGYPTFYTKERIWTTWGPAYMYVLSDEFLNGGDYANYPPVDQGEWKHAS